MFWMMILCSSYSWENLKSLIDQNHVDSIQLNAARDIYKYVYANSFLLMHSIECKSVILCSFPISLEKKLDRISFHLLA